MHNDLPKYYRYDVSGSQLDLFSSPSVGKLPCGGKEEAATKAMWLVGMSPSFHHGKDS